MRKTSNIKTKEKLESFFVQLHLLPQLPPSNLRHLQALLSPKAKMPRVHRVPLPQRLSLAEESVPLCLSLRPLLPRQNQLPPLLHCHLCHLPLLPHLAAPLLIRVTVQAQKLSRLANRVRLKRERHLCLLLSPSARPQELMKSQQSLASSIM